MRYSLPSISLAGVALAAALMTPLPTAPHSMDRPAVPSKAGMVVHLQLSGGYRYTGTLTHAEDARDTIPAQYSCVRFTHPNFASRGKPLAYNVSFDNPGVSAATGGVFFAFYYNPKISGYQRVDGETGVNLAVVPAQYKSFAPGGEGTYKIMVKLAPDGHSGTFTATNFRNIVGTESHTRPGENYGDDPAAKQRDHAVVSHHGSDNRANRPTYRPADGVDHDQQICPP